MAALKAPEASFRGGSRLVRPPRGTARPGPGGRRSTRRRASLSGRRSRSRRHLAGAQQPEGRQAGVGVSGDVIVAQTGVAPLRMRSVPLHGSGDKRVARLQRVQVLVAHVLVLRAFQHCQRDAEGHRLLLHSGVEVDGQQLAETCAVRAGSSVRSQQVLDRGTRLLLLLLAALVGHDGAGGEVVARERPDVTHLVAEVALDGLQASSQHLVAVRQRRIALRQGLDEALLLEELLQRLLQVAEERALLRAILDRFERVLFGAVALRFTVQAAQRRLQKRNVIR
mmetsp:Transcript_3540/g.11018  ORF Transcript_3540/g.11018 Transcript_3540/m.11018 type:complete len:282 (-) Transcript_3540:199-1044(-)